MFVLRLASALTLAAGLVGLPAPATAGEGATEENWATARARALTAQGDAQRASGHVEVAVKRYAEAISTDGTFEPAYLALASLRAATGEYDEALVVLAIGLERVPGFDGALEARAEILTVAKRWSDATVAYLDVLRRHPDDEAVLVKVVSVSVRAGRFAVALAAARKIAVLARERGDAAAEKEARLTARALQKILREVDPVDAGRTSGDAVRRAIARAL